MSTDRTQAPFSFAENAPVKTTWRGLVVVGGGLVTFFGSWMLLRAQVQNQETRLSAAETAIVAQAGEQRATRELLIRIDENVKALKERAR